MSTNQTKAVTPAEHLNDVENHKKIAANLETAAKHHREAAKHHEAGEHEKAAKSTVVAQEHLSLAHQGQKEDAKHHGVTK
jgi:hypothetical protein